MLTGMRRMFSKRPPKDYVAQKAALQSSNAKERLDLARNAETK